MGRVFLLKIHQNSAFESIFLVFPLKVLYNRSSLTVSSGFQCGDKIKHAQQGDKPAFNILATGVYQIFFSFEVHYLMQIFAYRVFLGKLYISYTKNGCLFVIDISIEILVFYFVQLMAKVMSSNTG